MPQVDNAKMKNESEDVCVWYKKGAADDNTDRHLKKNSFEMQHTKHVNIETLNCVQQQQKLQVLYKWL